MPTIAVAGTEPGAGATTVAVELSAALSLKGRRVALTQVGGATAQTVRLALEADGSHARTGLRVAAGDRHADSDCVVLDLGSRRSITRADLALLVSPAGRATAAPAQLGAQHMHLIVNRDRALSPADDSGLLRVPEDLSVPAAQAAGEPVIVQFPRSRAALAFRRLADAVDPSHPGPWQDSSGVPPAG